jgi:hypothetical protein
MNFLSCLKSCQESLHRTLYRLVSINPFSFTFFVISSIVHVTENSPVALFHFEGYALALFIFWRQVSWYFTKREVYFFKICKIEIIINSSHKFISTYIYLLMCRLLSKLPIIPPTQSRKSLC